MTYKFLLIRRVHIEKKVGGSATSQPPLSPAPAKTAVVPLEPQLDKAELNRNAKQAEANLDRACETPVPRGDTPRRGSPLGTPTGASTRTHSGL